MADLIELREGDTPWQPHDTDAPVVLNVYDVPTLGVVRQHGVNFLFRQLDDIDDASFWAYTRIDDFDTHRVADLPPEAIDELVIGYAAEPSKVAIAGECRIMAWAALDCLDAECIIEGMRELKAALEDHIRRAQSGSRLLSAAS